MSHDELLAEVLSLPRKDREQLAHEILRSLGEEVSEEEWSTAWAAELNARIAAMKAGAEGVPVDELFDRLERESGRKAS